MRKNNWIVAAIAAVACGVLLWAWFALGFSYVDDWEGEVVAAHDPGAEPRPFASREDLAALLAA